MHPCAWATKPFREANLTAVNLILDAQSLWEDYRMSASSGSRSDPTRQYSMAISVGGKEMPLARLSVAGLRTILARNMERIQVPLRCHRGKLAATKARLELCFSSHQKEKEPSFSGGALNEPHMRKNVRDIQNETMKDIPRAFHWQIIKSGATRRLFKHTAISNYSPVKS
ncbi:hypothetical protein L218DRAFT_943358 [Marasmius fiardii PR-910]|nr:hypothetical protein L218DRAFT_943358 [Marasmius fiardii PR-910]